MGHTKPEKLTDLVVELETIRKLSGLKEKSPGIFYFKSISFMHFHDADGDRWVDVKRNGEWKKVPIPFEATKSERKKFIEAVQRAHREIS